MDGFITTPPGRVPRVRTCPTLWDRLGDCRARLGLDRNNYTVNPGLYAVGDPSPDDPVVVTANYKLTFDTVRFALRGRNVWLLVTDTRGINVWCAGGKGSFNAEAVALQVRKADLDRVVAHRRLILPQLAANGVRLRDVRKATGFETVLGPIRAEDLPRFLDQGPDEAMREVTFTFRERLAVVPVELVLGWKMILAVLAAAAVLGLIGTEFAPGAVFQRWAVAATATLFGLLGGTVAFPLLLPRLPTRLFSLAGAGLGLIPALALPLLFPTPAWPVLAGAGLWTMTLSAWTALNFTGSTPYTSPSGVEKEMRAAIPILAGSTVVSVICFIWGNLQ
ncbi:CO dehydrogenase/acetyl-CoA synthase delta subunit [Desulfonatronum zhilinae]|nr:CO dehydrogenase/acetyl-CoA synthase delta subunit [Desulfonatronum zhilinae]